MPHGHEPDQHQARPRCRPAPLGIVAVATDGTIHRWNAAAEGILGWSESDVMGRPATDFGMTSGDATGAGGSRDLTVSDRDGRPVHIRIFASTPEAGSRDGRVLVFLDRRREIATEAALRRSQKLEAVGRLAGGIAHEFNNILTTVIGHAALLTESLGSDDARREHAGEVRQSAERAAALTRQLLVFSGKHITRTEPVDLGALLNDMNSVIEHLSGEKITASYQIDGSLWPVRCDAAQLHQLVLNLVVNAREAMPEGGTLSVVTTNIHVIEPDAVDRVPAGDYVLLRVSDTGRGMSPDTLTHLFEPFFTTKEQGTGLGLATVHGIVQQFDGHIRVESALGRGSRFDIYLPRATPHQSVAPVPGAHVNGGATLLIVEDDDAVRDLTCRILRRTGHRVLSARNGHEALAVLNSGEMVQLVIADIVMPGMNGIELGEHIRRDFPTLPVLFTSGYVAPDVGDAVGLADGSRFMEKPYRPDQLVARVSELLQ